MRKRKPVSALMFDIHAARRQAEAVLAVAERPPEGTMPPAPDKLAALRADVALLYSAPARRITVSRGVQGVSSRYKALSRELYDMCSDIRGRVKDRYRSEQHQELRRAFGEALPAAREKPPTVISFAEQLLKAASKHANVLREIRLRAPSLKKLDRLTTSLRSCPEERAEKRAARRQTNQELRQTVRRVLILCEELAAP